jgi:5-methylcytosine-specific restriction protein A
MKVCSQPGCPEFTTGGRCAEHRRQAERRRGSASQRGYGQQHRQRFRRGVLDRDPVCVLCKQAPATVADHWPKSRRQLAAEGLDPNDPRNGRGLCASCHGRATATNPEQAGGWNAEQ